MNASHLSQRTGSVFRKWLSFFLESEVFMNMRLLRFVEMVISVFIGVHADIIL